MDSSSFPNCDFLPKKTLKLTPDAHLRGLKLRGQIKAKIRSMSNPRAAIGGNVSDIFRPGNYAIDWTRDSTSREQFHSGLRKDRGGRYWNNSHFNPDDDNQPGSFEESRNENLTKEKDALNSLKILSMQQDTDNPLEKEIDKIIHNVDFYTTKMILQKRKKKEENSKQHSTTLTSFMKQDAACQTTAPEDETKTPKLQANQEMNRTSPEPFRARVKTFLLIKQEPEEQAVQPKSPSKLAHLYRLSPRIAKELKPFEIDRRIKFFQQDSEKLDTSQTDKRVFFSTKSEFGPLRGKTRSATTLPLKEKVINIQERRSTIKEIQHLRIEPIKTTQDTVRKVNTSSTSPRNQLVKKDQNSQVFPKLKASQSSSVLANPLGRSFSKEPLPRTLKYYDIFSKASQLTSLESRKDSLKPFQDGHASTISSIDSSVSMLGPKVELSQRFSVHKRQQPINLQPYTKKYL